MSITQEDWQRYREITGEQKLRKLLRHVAELGNFHMAENNIQAMVVCADIIRTGEQLYGHAYMNRILAEAKSEAVVPEGDELLKCDVCGQTPVVSIDIVGGEDGVSLVSRHHCREHERRAAACSIMPAIPKQ